MASTGVYKYFVINLFDVFQEPDPESEKEEEDDYNYEDEEFEVNIK